MIIKPRKPQASFFCAQYFLYPAGRAYGGKKRAGTSRNGSDCVANAFRCCRETGDLSEVSHSNVKRYIELCYKKTYFEKCTLRRSPKTLRSPKEHEDGYQPGALPIKNASTYISVRSPILRFNRPGKGLRIGWLGSKPTPSS